MTITPHRQFLLVSTDRYVPERIICVLPAGFCFDGRSAVIRSQQTYLTSALCNARMDAANTTTCVFNVGAICVKSMITQYDVLSCLPFSANITSLRVHGSIFVKVLKNVYILC
ncbi:unnamed protein product [Rotaria sp. Silwood1]|nr:unnamed protein product [Rotaria sp. Silwood1]CAF3507097.1 unnamed protein product [Rotaria sp. Silwood1]CAF3605890.1 unnamed protein product [Rotaria sp. Silwood1]CAF4644336.1 unnamed protein product [Rotaria sp. Silwood1]CAF4947105.1 unnamed protein product [Rotaria sp. Silwood1]